MRLNIIHFIIDDKFIDGAISLFEIDNSVRNTYAILGDKRQLKYVKNKNILFINKERCVEEIDKYDVLFLHSLPSVPLKCIDKIKNSVKIVWLAWGYDIYEAPLDLISIKKYGQKTKAEIWSKEAIREIHIKNLINRIYHARYLKRALKRIDYFSGVFPYEIDMVKAAHPEFRALPLDFYYGSKDFFIPETPSTEINHGKHNVIIGNSANPTNNHLDIIDSISSVYHANDSKLIIPLSYGGTKAYINKVLKAAEIIAPGNVFPLQSFLPLSEYIDLISSCRVAIYAHERQQASDNIFMQLIYGARVYMSETSAAYGYLKDLGLKVYSLQNELDLFNIEMKTEDIIENRKILSDLYAPSRLIKRVMSIFITLRNNCNIENENTNLLYSI